MILLYTLENMMKTYIRLRYGIGSTVPSTILLLHRHTYGVPVMVRGLGERGQLSSCTGPGIIHAADAISPYSTHIYTASVAVADADHATTNHRMSSIPRPQPPPAPRRSK